MAEVDSLTVKVYADTTNAVTSIKNVTRAVKELNASASDRGWSSFTRSITNIGNASKGMGKLVSSLKRIEGMQISPSLKENLDKIADAGAKLSGVGKGMHQFGYGLAKLSQLGESTGKLGENLRRVSSHVIEFSKSLSKFIPQDLSSKVATLTRLASTVKSFSKVGEDKDLKTKFSTVASAVGSFATQLNNAISDEMLARLEKISTVLTDIAKTAGAAGKAVKDVTKANEAFARASKKAASDTISVWKNIVKAIETANRALSEIGTDLYGVLDASGIIGDLDSISGAVSKNIPILGELTSAWKAEAAAVKNILLSQQSVIDKAADLMLVKVKKIITLLYSFAKLPFSPASMKANAGLFSLVRLPLKDFANNVANLAKKWNHFIASLSRVAVYRLLRTALKELAAGIKEGIQNLYQWAEAWRGIYSSADRFLASMDRLATAFFYLKNATGAAVSPLIDYVAPIIDTLIDKFVALANAINQAMAALTGAGIWRKAIKYPITYAEAADLASSKVKDLKRTVLSFDELNRLDDNKNKGGSSKWAPDYSQLFEEMPVDSWINDILNSTSWRILGTGIANKINEALASIKWDKINSTVRKWARRLGTLFDGLLVGINMPLFGKSIAEGLNTVANAINTFFKEIHFREIGQHLADGFTSMIHNLSWDEIGKALTQKWKALFELVIGFKDVDMSGLGSGIVELFTSAIENLPISELVGAIKTLLPKIGTELGVAIGGIITEINNVINGKGHDGPGGQRKGGGIDAFGLGAAFSSAIDNMLAGIDPKEAGIFLSNGIKKIIEFATGALKTLPFEEMKSWVSTMITSLFKNIDLKQGVQNAIDIASKLVQLLTTAVNAIPWEDVGTAIEDSDTTELKEGIKGLFKSVTDALERSGFMDEVATGIATYFGLKLAGAIGKILPTILTTKAITSAAGGAGAGAGGAAGGGVLATIFGSLFQGGAIATAGAVLGQQLSHHVIGPLLAGFGSADAELYKSWTFFGENGLFQASLDNAKMKMEDFEGGIEHFGETHKNLWDDLEEKDWGGFITDIGDAWETEHPIITAGMESIQDAVSSLDLTWSGFVSSWSSGIDAIMNGISTLTGANLSGLNLVVDDTKVKTRNTSTRRVTRRAVGGTVDKGDLFLAGENGPEIVTSFGGESAVMNMDQIISTISQSVAVANGGDITIPISLDGGLLDKVIVTAQQRQSLRSGR